MKQILVDTGADWGGFYVDGVLMMQGHPEDLMERVILEYTDIRLEWDSDFMEDDGRWAKSNIEGD